MNSFSSVLAISMVLSVLPPSVIMMRVSRFSLSLTSVFTKSSIWNSSFRHGIIIKVLGLFCVIDAL